MRCCDHHAPNGLVWGIAPFLSDPDALLKSLWVAMKSLIDGYSEIFAAMPQAIEEHVASHAPWGFDLQDLWRSVWLALGITPGTLDILLELELYSDGVFIMVL